MTEDYDKENLPAETVTVDGKTWKREKFETDGYQWVREMDEDEYGWDTDDVSLVDTDVPIRVVAVQHYGQEWTVDASETAGPNYHRPGFTELISSEYSETFENASDAFETVERFIEELS